MQQYDSSFGERRTIYIVKREGKTVFVGRLKQIRRRFRQQWSNVPLQFLPTEVERLGFSLIPVSKIPTLREDVHKLMLFQNIHGTVTSASKDMPRNALAPKTRYTTGMPNKNNRIDEFLTLKDKLKDIPHKPGVYKFLDKDNSVLYVGKAKDLRSRVSQYFGTGDSRVQLPFLMAEAADFDYTIVNSELESLFLENTLIKEYMPPYNIKLRDDKNYAFIKIDYSTPIPQITYARKVETDSKDNNYFGPYSSTKKIRTTLDFVRRVFPYCANKEIGKRPCFYYYLHRCPGICIGAVTPQEYEAQLKRIAMFLSGQTSEIKKQLVVEMKTAASNHQFETATRLRDQLRAIEVLDERQITMFPERVSWDFVSVFADPLTACVNVFKVREGKLIDKENFIYENILNIPENIRASSIIQTFSEMYYAQTTNLPKEIYTETDLQNSHLLSELLITRSKQKVKLNVPTRGQKLKLIILGKTNAEEYLRKWQRSQATNLDSLQEILQSLQTILNLPRLPHRIECYDISNTQGTNPVGSMVVFKDGQPAKSEYRKFKITSKQTPDDFLMMREMLTRRLSRVRPAVNDAEVIEQSSSKHAVDNASDKANTPSSETGSVTSTQSQSGTVKEKEYWPTPDLLVIDGGKGQLGIAVEILAEMNLVIPVIGLAKRIEEIFKPHNLQPIVLEHDNPALQMLQRLRDEAHRFGITFHRSLRSKQAVQSALDTIPGIGPKTKKLLKLKIGTVDQIKKTPTEELILLVGQARAEQIKKYL